MDLPEIADEVQCTDNTPCFVGRHSYIFNGILHGDTEVAIKVIRSVNSSFRLMKRKFKRESEVWARLTHQNIVPLYGFLEDTTKFGPIGALVLPWYKNGDAEWFFREKGHLLTTNQRAGIWCGVVAGVCYLHRQHPPIIHGNLRPVHVEFKLLTGMSELILCEG